jgi:hypothetical protein
VTAFNKLATVRGSRRPPVGFAGQAVSKLGIEVEGAEGDVTDGEGYGQGVADAVFAGRLAEGRPPIVTPRKVDHLSSPECQKTGAHVGLVLRQIQFEGEVIGIHRRDGSAALDQRDAGSRAVRQRSGGELGDPLQDAHQGLLRRHFSQFGQDGREVIAQRRRLAFGLCFPRLRHQRAERWSGG